MRQKQIVSLLVLLISCFAASAVAQRTRHQEIIRGNERELRVIVEVSFGTIVIAPGESDKILVADFTGRKDRGSRDVQVDYTTRGDRGELVIKSKDRSRFWKDDEHNGDNDDRTWTLRFTDAVPMDLKIELGAGKGEVDLTGLQLRTMKISSGASSVDLFCDKPNPINAESIIIESGVSKFTATNLGNTNFRKLKFSGGVGAYKLDFGGKLRQDADVKVEVGLGAVTINIPYDTPVRLVYDDSWFSSFDLDNGFTKRKGGIYETEDYNRSEPTLSIQIESGLGSVKVRRR